MLLYTTSLDRPSPIDKIRHFFCLIFYGLSASVQGAVRAVRARYWPPPQQVYVHTQQLARYVLVTWLIYRWGVGDPYATFTCILLLTGQHCENAYCCRVLTIALLSGSTQDTSGCVRMASVLVSCFAPLFPPAGRPSFADSLASIEEWSRKHHMLKPLRHTACPEERSVANLIAKLRTRCSQSIGPGRSQPQLSEAEATAFNTLLSSLQSAAPAQSVQSKKKASMPCSTPAADVACASADAVCEPQHNEVAVTLESIEEWSKKHPLLTPLPGGIGRPPAQIVADGF